MPNVSMPCNNNRFSAAPQLRSAAALSPCRRPLKYLGESSDHIDLWRALTRDSNCRFPTRCLVCTAPGAAGVRVRDALAWTRRAGSRWPMRPRHSWRRATQDQDDVVFSKAFAPSKRFLFPLQSLNFDRLDVFCSLNFLYDFRFDLDCCQFCFFFFVLVCEKFFGT
jgi:hypothetical protein